MSSNAKGALLALLAFGVFSTHDVFIKKLGALYSPIQIVFFSVLLSFPLATIMLMRDGKPGTLVPVHPWWMLLRTVAAVVTGFSAFYAFANLPLTQTYAILFATPLLITILSIPILGETVRIMRWAAVIVGLCGVMIVLRPGTTDLGLGHEQRSWLHFRAHSCRSLSARSEQKNGPWSCFFTRWLAILW